MSILSSWAVNRSMSRVEIPVLLISLATRVFLGLNLLLPLPWMGATVEASKIGLEQEIGRWSSFARAFA